MALVISGSLSLGSALPQLGSFVSASLSAAAIFPMIDEVDIIIEKSVRCMHECFEGVSCLH